MIDWFLLALMLGIQFHLWQRAAETMDDFLEEWTFDGTFLPLEAWRLGQTQGDR